MESENLDIESITEARRQAIERTIEPIATEKLRALGEKLFPALDHPWRQVFFDFLDQHAQTTVYHAATNEGAEIIYSPEVEKGIVVHARGRRRPIASQEAPNPEGSRTKAVTSASPKENNLSGAGERGLEVGTPFPSLRRGNDHQDQGRQGGQDQGRHMSGERHEKAQQDNSGQMRPWKRAGYRPSEQHVAGQENRPARQDGDHRFGVRVPERMGQHEFVRDGRNDDSCDNEQVNIGIREARQFPRILRTRDRLARRFGARVEIEPPHRDAAGKGNAEREEHRQRPIQAAEGRAGYQNGFTEGDDHKKGAPFRQMTAFDIPVARR